MYYLVAPLVSFLVAFGMLHGLLRSAVAGAVLDYPNQRSLHTLATPRTGGLALMAGILAGWFAAQASWSWVVVLMFFLSAVSFLDDLRGLSIVWRFFAHFVAAVVLVKLYIFSDVGFVGAAIVALATVWVTNLYNFMDGSDGLAGGMTLFGFFFYGVAAWLQGDVAFAGLNWSVAAASLAFLLFNFHPARIFMGDVGSIPLGFLAAAFGLLGWRADYWPWWFPVLVFSPFVLDASVTLVKRLLRGEKVWQAHREHYYQRLVQMGWGHRRTALVGYVLMVLVGGSATWVIGLGSRAQLAFGIGWGVLYLLAMWLVDAKWLRMQRQSGC